MTLATALRTSYSARQAYQSALKTYRREKASHLRQQATSRNYEHYQADPVGFGERELAQQYTPDVERMMESVRDNIVTLARSANGTGKTHGAASVATWFYKSFPGAQVYTAAAPPEQNLKNLLWGEIEALTRSRPALFADDDLNVLRIRRHPKEFITGVAIPTTGTASQREAKFSGKHAPHLLFIIDEGDAVPAEVYKGIESCMSGGHVRLLVLFNPRAERGPVYIKERDRQANVVELSALDHPNVVTGENIIPGAVDRETTVRRINQWSRPLVGDTPSGRGTGERPDQECFTVPEYLVGVVAHDQKGTPYPPLPAGVRKIINPALSYMVLALYPAQAENQLISQAWVNAARARWDAYVAQYGEVPPKGVQPVAGHDVAEEGKDKNVQTFRYGGWVDRALIWGGIDTDASATKAAENSKRRKARVTHTDETGLGSGTAAKMTRLKVPAHGVKVASAPTTRSEEGEFEQLRDQLYWSVREWLRTDPGAMLPPSENLIEELTTPTYHKTRKGKIKVMEKVVMRELLRRSPDELDSLALTFAPGEPAKLPKEQPGHDSRWQSETTGRTRLDSGGRWKRY